MRIVYVLTSLGMGGAERQVLALAARMAARGHSVALMVLRPELESEWPTALQVHHLNMRKSILSLASGWLRGIRFLIKFRPDVVHSHSFHANFIARLLKLFLPSTAVLSTIHNVYEGGRARMAAYRLTDWLCRRTTAVSTAAANRFVALKAVPATKCMVLTNGIDTDEFAPDPRRREAMRAAMGVTNEFVWFTAGRVVPAKDFPNLLRAFGLVSSALPEIRLWIAGQARDAHSHPATEFVAGATQGFMDQVRWLGLRRDLPALLDAADAFVLASAWEGMPLVVGEAMAMQKPVVATDVGGVRELTGDTGMLVPAGDSFALAKAMLAMTGRSIDDRHALGQAARLRIVTGFSMDSRVEQWESVYEATSSRRR